MSDNIQINLSEIVNSSLTKIVNDQLGAIVEKHLVSAIDSVINNAFSYNSKIRKQIEDAVSSKMVLNVHELTIPEYNKLMISIVNEALCRTAHLEGLEKLKKDTDEMLTKSIPSEMKVSELIAEFARDTSAGEERSENITFIHESERGFHHYYIDKESNKDKWDCDINFATHNGKIYTARIDGFDPTKQVKIGSFYGFKEKLFRLYAAGTIIIPDVENVETEYYYDED